MADAGEADTNGSPNPPEKGPPHVKEGRLDQLATLARKNFYAALSLGLAITGVIVSVVGLHINSAWPLTIGGVVLVVTGLAINWLWGRKDVIRTAIVIASAMSVGVGGAAIAWAHPRTVSIHVTTTIYQGSPMVTIDQPEPGSWINPTPDVSGALSGIGPDQYVWVLNQQFDPGKPQTIGDLLYPAESCSISDDRSSFSCPQIFTGDEAQDYCRKILVWIAIVSSSQNTALEKRTVDGNETPYQISWPAQPQHIGNGVAAVEVQRNPQSGTACPPGQ